MKPTEVHVSWLAPDDYCGTCRVIYEDNHLICVEKPQGLLSQGDDSGDDDAFSLIKRDIAIRANKPGEAFLGLVHRLDRNTGGTMVFAKTSKGASRLSDELRNKRFAKGYFAICHGRIPKCERYLTDKLIKDEKTNAVKKSKDGKPCTLYIKTLAYEKDTTLVFCVPITGRTHQIRVQMAIFGYPLIGDIKYGGPKASNYGASDNMTIGLWSSVIAVKHPTKDLIMAFASVPPKKSLWSIYENAEYRKFASDTVEKNLEKLMNLKEEGR